MRLQTLPSRGVAPRIAGRNASSKPAIARRAVTLAARNEVSPATESLNMLEAFFIGRALAEVINERLGSAVGDTVANLGRLDGELRRSVQDLQDDVMARAQRDMAAAAGGSGSSGGGGGGGGRGRALIAAPPDLGESVDNLRAEVAAARALVQQIKLKPSVLK